MKRTKLKLKWSVKCSTCSGVLLQWIIRAHKRISAEFSQALLDGNPRIDKTSCGTSKKASCWPKIT